MSGLLLAIATQDVPPTPENVRPGWIALLVVGLLILATVVLLRSFVKHARRAREPWPDDSPDETNDDDSAP
jgi:hypothetical protein